MIHFIIHKILLDYILIGFVVWKILRGWLYPLMDTWMKKEGGVAKTSTQRYLAITEHYWSGHTTESVLDCRQGHCGKVFKLEVPQVQQLEQPQTLRLSDNR